MTRSPDAMIDRALRFRGFLIAGIFLLGTSIGCGRDQGHRADSSRVADSTIRILAVGDVMLGSDYPTPDLLPPDDGAPLLAPLRAVASRGDLVFGNLEGPMLDGGKTTKCIDPKNCYAFRTPTRFGRRLSEAGFTVMSIANNHALDFGEDGRRSTLRVLDSLGIGHSGPVGDVYHTTIRGRSVSLIAFAFDNDSYNLLDIEGAVAAVKALAARCDILIVSCHGGAEGAKHQHLPDAMEIAFGEQRGQLRKFAHAVVDAGADLVVGHGPHVVRGLEVYRRRLIAYSLGNFATYAQFNLNGPNGLACVLEADLGPDGRFAGGRIHATRQEKPGGALADPAREIIPIIRQLSKEDFGTRAPMIGEDGVIR